MRNDVDLSAFSKGELSPRLRGRTDYKGYFEGCDTMLNMVVLPQGGATRRPGTLYSANVKDQSGGARLIDFQFNTTQAYILEFGAGYIRVYKDLAPVVNTLTITGAANNGSGAIRLTCASTAGLYTGNTAVVSGVGGVPNATGTWTISNVTATTFDLTSSTWGGAYTAGGTAVVTVEIPTSYTIDQVNALHWCQSNDYLYLCHPSVKPKTLTRSSHTNWTLSDLTYLDGPYLDRVGTPTIAASNSVGVVTITASSSLFVTTDVGRIMRMRVLSGSALWGWVEFTSYSTATQMTATVKSEVYNGATSEIPLGPTGEWQLGRWSDTLGWPWIPVFWQNRLFFIGDNTNPAIIAFSNSGAYTTMSPSKADGTVIDSNGGVFAMTGNQVNSARWASPAGSAQTPQLAIGTASDEHILQAGAAGTAFSPTSVQVYEETSLTGRANARTIRVGKSTLFANSSGRKLHEFQFNWQVNGFLGPDRTVESEHITRGQIADLDFQRTPYGVVWARMADGSLMGMTYLPEQQINAWHRHELGGNYYGAAPVVESISVIPSADATYDQLWMIVKRTINGSVVRTIEVMGQYFDTQMQEDATFVDCALQSTPTSQAATLTFSAASGSGVTFVAGSAVFSGGDVGKYLRAANGVAVITGYSSTTVVTGEWLSDADSTAPVSSGDWTMDAKTSTFTGLTHLVGETVRVFGDGADLGTATVDGSGQVTISGGNGTASFATIGLDYDYRLVTMPWAAQSANVIQGHEKKITTLWLRFLDSLGASYGRQIVDPMTFEVEDATDEMESRLNADMTDAPPPLFTGIVRVPSPGGFDREGQIVIKGSGPYPCTVLAIIGSADVGDMPGDQ